MWNKPEAIASRWQAFNTSVWFPIHYQCGFKEIPYIREFVVWRKYYWRLFATWARWLWQEPVPSLSLSIRIFWGDIQKFTECLRNIVIFIIRAVNDISQEYLGLIRHGWALCFEFPVIFKKQSLLISQNYRSGFGNWLDLINFLINGMHLCFLESYFCCFCCLHSFNPYTLRWYFSPFIS